MLSVFNTIIQRNGLKVKYKSALALLARCSALYLFAVVKILYGNCAECARTFKAALRPAAQHRARAYAGGYAAFAEGDVAVADGVDDVQPPAALRKNVGQTAAQPEGFCALGRDGDNDDAPLHSSAEARSAFAVADDVGEKLAADQPAEKHVIFGQSAAEQIVGEPLQLVVHVI